MACNPIPFSLLLPSSFSLLSFFPRHIWHDLYAGRWLASLAEKYPQLLAEYTEHIATRPPRAAGTLQQTSPPDAAVERTADEGEEEGAAPAAVPDNMFSDIGDSGSARLSAADDGQASGAASDGEAPADPETETETETARDEGHAEANVDVDAVQAEEEEEDEEEAAPLHPLAYFADHGNRILFLNLAEWIICYQDTFLEGQGKESTRTCVCV